MDPGSGASQHLGDFIAREIIQSDERDHFRVLIAQARQAQLDVANEDYLFFEAGNGMMRNLRTEELPSQQGRQPSHLARELEEVPHDGQRLPTKTQHFRPGIDLKQVFLAPIFFTKHWQPRLADGWRRSSHCALPQASSSRASPCKNGRSSFGVRGLRRSNFDCRASPGSGRLNSKCPQGWQYVSDESARRNRNEPHRSQYFSS